MKTITVQGDAKGTIIPEMSGWKGTVVEEKRKKLVLIYFSKGGR